MPDSCFRRNKKNEPLFGFLKYWLKKTHTFVFYTSRVPTDQLYMKIYQVGYFTTAKDVVSVVQYMLLNGDSHSPAILWYTQK